MKVFRRFLPTLVISAVLVATGLESTLIGHKVATADAASLLLKWTPCDGTVGELSLVNPGFGIHCVIPGVLGTDYSTYYPPAQTSNPVCHNGDIPVLIGNSAASVYVADCVHFLQGTQLIKLTSRPNVTSNVHNGDCTALTGDTKAYCLALVVNAGAQSSNCPKTATIGLTLDCAGKNPIYALIEFIINWIVRLLIVGATVMIVISGIQYIVSQGNPEGIKAAKSRLANAIVGLILLSLMFVILRVIGVSS